ncbi:putative N-acetyl-gamma-glutamyl-phosphate reductase, chloroplastic [Bidens hawaiensis]|uniref:putative N-acetyl-gamma-glutamyl-phosphate reductase, chloroplastic n=1 Tax=Bidens hawaiensis TaxID=980011 RepID=UPI00404A8A03
MNSMVAMRSLFTDGGYFSRFEDKPKMLKSSKRPVKMLAVSSQKADKSIKVGILGASGYTGVELIRFIANHPYFSISLMTADRKAGQSIASVFPHLITQVSICCKYYA